MASVTSPAAAQSLFATRGLGVPVAAVDARGAALGGIGVGLLGFHTSLVNPAELAGLTRRGVSAALQPISSSVEADGQQDGTSGTRFPLLSVLYPVSERLVLSLGYGGYLDQTWGVVTESEQTINGESVTVNDLLRSTGGIAQMRLSAAYSLSPVFSIGAAAGLLAGNVDRLAVRTFDDEAGQIQFFEERMRWRYSAPIAAVGFRWDPANRVRIGASAMTGADLKARSDDEGAEDRDYGAPLEVNAGASLRLSSLLMATAGGTWGRAPTTTGTTISTNTMRIGGGLEYQGLRSGLRTYPVRLGAHWAQLPYHMDDETQPTETGVSAGLGFRLGDPMDPAAIADFSVGRATRGGLDGGVVTGGVDEQLWRFTFSLSIFAR
jgi:long-subunit fatty acid transport protein